MNDKLKGADGALAKATASTSAADVGELTPEAVASKIAAVMHTAIETDAETARYRIDKEAQTYEAALKVEDRADARAHDLEKVRLAAAMNSRSQARRYGAGLVVLVFAFATGLAIAGNVREAMEIAGTAAAAGFGFFGGRSIGREQGRRIGEARAREEASNDEP